MIPLDLTIKIKTLPESAGVYKFFNKKSTIIYIGKAKNLKRRVNSYFNKNHHNFKTNLLVKQIFSVDIIIVESEMDALLLENNLIKNISDLEREAGKMMGKTLITHQTGPEGKEVKRLYIEEASDIAKEFYLSCLVDRETAKIAFISSTEGGMDIEKVASENPEKIITKKIDFRKKIG